MNFLYVNNYLSIFNNIIIKYMMYFLQEKMTTIQLIAIRYYCANSGAPENLRPGRPTYLGSIFWLFYRIQIIKKSSWLHRLSNVNNRQSEHGSCGEYITWKYAVF